MLSADPISYFIALIIAALAVNFIARRKSAVFVQNFLFLMTVLALAVIFKGSEGKVILLVLFYLAVIHLAKKFENIPKGYFVMVSILPLLLFKLSDVIPSFIVFKKAVAILGISYMTFRVIQILLDLDGYRPKRFVNVVLFLVNPLTLLAGPIDRFERFETNLENIKSNLNAETFFKGWNFLLVGIIQKFVLAYFWSEFVMSKFNHYTYDFKDIVGTAYSYTVYLFLDFSGYSLMAMGAGYMIGILFPPNFDQPWKTKNPKDLWKRFHITLGSFLNDYFFKPIYMSLMRKAYFKSHRLLAQNLALMCTFLLMGAWNGLKWHYILSGAMFGLSSVVYNTYQAKFGNKESLILTNGMIMVYRFFFINYVIWALYLFSGKMPV